MKKQMEIDLFEFGDAVSDGICFTDGDGVVIGVNKSFLEITGVSYGEIVGKSIDKMPSQPLLGRTHEDNQDIFEMQTSFRETLTFMLSKQKNSMSSLFYIAKTNKQVLLTIKLLHDKEGNLARIIHVLRDMSEINRLREQLENVEKERNRYANEIDYLKNNIGQIQNLIVNSSPMKSIKEIIDYVSKTDVTILITGETGCGKEVIAREIQSGSQRKTAPYIKVNCAAIPESLIEAELFGYEKGAFTGAGTKTKAGMFELADKGTLFLDEIGELPLNMQAKLLRVLQEKEILRIGGTKSVKLDVRILAATNQNLKELIKQGKFREDLYFRLNVVPIKIPPLRERKEDIPVLAYYFLKKFNLKYDREKTFDNSAVKAMEAYDWPGNVRELENSIERLMVIDNDNKITGEKIENITGHRVNLPKVYKGLTLKESVEMVEREMIENALKTCGSTHKAAKILGITQPTVFRKAKALNIRID